MASLGASWAVFGASWRSRVPLGYLGEPLGSSWGSLGSLLEASWAPLGALLGRSWGALGSFRGTLGAILEEMYQRRGVLN